MAGPLAAADAIVVAAGASSRMAGVDKRLALLAGRPLLARSLDAIAAAAVVERIVLVMGPGPALEALRPFLPPAVVAIVPGGEHRGASVAAGLAALAALDGDAADPDRVVLVHDGARPLVAPELVTAIAEAAHEHGAAIPIVPVAETIRRLRAGELGETVDRADLVAAQTPQGVRSGLLRDAYRRYPADGSARFTDEAALLMACTIRVHPVPGDPVNLKVTLPADLARAEALFGARTERRIGFGARAERRTGLGLDSHPFGPGAPLLLGGLEIPGAPRLHGHSDGDVALHAIAGGLLGAAAMGDLGRLFPADGRTPRGVGSRELLVDVAGRVAAAGWRVAAIDLTITGARPYLGAHLDPMRDAIATLLELPPGAVGVKASTGNLDGATGAGRAIAASAVVTLDRIAPAPSPATSSAPTLAPPRVPGAHPDLS